MRTDCSRSEDLEPHLGDPHVALSPEETALKPPPLYKVLLFNDDYTPMEFVVDLLQRFFGLSVAQATQIMLHIHTQGRGVCGLYPYDIAETKVSQVNAFARHHQHPLLCDLEKD